MAGEGGQDDVRDGALRLAVGDGHQVRPRVLVLDVEPLQRALPSAPRRPPGPPPPRPRRPGSRHRSRAGYLEHVAQRVLHGVEGGLRRRRCARAPRRRRRLRAAPPPRWSPAGAAGRTRCRGRAGPARSPTPRPAARRPTPPRSRPPARRCTAPRPRSGTAPGELSRQRREHGPARGGVVDRPGALRADPAVSTRPDARSTVQWSGVTCPDTTDSPSPQLPSTTSVPRSPVTGSRVNATPAERASTSSSTPTARSCTRSGRGAAEPAPVGQGVRGEPARPAPPDVQQHLVDAGHPEVGLVLPGEAGRVPVLAHRRRPDGHPQRRAPPGPVPQPRVRVRDRVREPRRQRLALDERAGLRRHERAPVTASAGHRCRLPRRRRDSCAERGAARPRAAAGSHPSSASAVTAYPSGTRYPSAASCPSRAIFGPTRAASPPRITPRSMTARARDRRATRHARTWTVPARPSTRIRSPGLDRPGWRWRCRPRRGCRTRG